MNAGNCWLRVIYFMIVSYATYNQGLNAVYQSCWIRSSSRINDGLQSKPRWDTYLTIDSLWSGTVRETNNDFPLFASNIHCVFPIHHWKLLTASVEFMFILRSGNWPVQQFTQNVFIRWRLAYEGLFPLMLGLRQFALHFSGRILWKFFRCWLKYNYRSLSLWTIVYISSRFYQRSGFAEHTNDRLLVTCCTVHSWGLSDTYLG